MSRSPILTAATAAFVAGGCATYHPDPVDLQAHAAAFAARLPDADEVRAFVAGLRAARPEVGPFDPADGIDRGEARLLALLLNPGLRQARLQAGVAAAQKEHAGLLPDPVLGVDVARVLESLPEPWIVAGSLGFTLPLSGRPGLERELLQGEHRQALQATRQQEAELLDGVDAAFIAYTAAVRRQQLLQQLLERLAGLEQIAGRLAEAQEITRLQARAFALERLQRAAELLAARAAAAAAALQLRQRMGLPPEAVLELVPTFDVAAGIDEAAARQRAAFDSRLVADGRAQCELAERRLQLAVSKQWPELSLSPGFERETGEDRLGLGISLPLPLWNGNAQEIAAATAARAAANQALCADYEQVRQRLAQAEARLAAAAAQRQLVEGELLPLCEQQVEDGRRLAELGQLDTLLQLDALLRSHAAQQAALDAVVEEQLAIVQLNGLFWPVLAAEVRR